CDRVGHPVWDPELQFLAVVVPGPDVAQVGTLVTDLDALASGHVRGGRAPAVRPGVILAPILGAIHQTTDPAVCRAPSGALFDHVDQVVGGIGRALEVAPSVVDP